MVDPVIPPDTAADITNTSDAANNAAIAFTGMGMSVEGASKELSGMSDMANAVSGVFKGFNNVLQEFTSSQMDSIGVTDDQVTKFGLLSTAVFGSRKAFDSLSGIKTDGLSTFGDKMKYITDSILSSGGGISELAGMVQKVTGQIMPDWAKASIGAAKNFIGALTESADNALRLQNAVVQLAGKTGGLNALYDKSGVNLENVNALLATQENMMLNSMKATGLNREQVENYWSALGAIPGALQQVMMTGSGAETTIDMLTATIKASNAVGRDAKEVIEDMHQAFKDYGLVGEDALKFTLRFSEISSAFGVDFDDVQKALKGSAAEMGHFADAGKAASSMAEGLAQQMKSMVGGLMDAGMTARDAVNAVSQLENNVGRLNIAQKAFLSSQSGGAGGLMGGFKIDKMLREGDFDKVFKMQMESVKKMMGGKIVTLDEASTSQAAASQMQKQIALLQQGPLGSMIKNPQDAYKMFDMFRGTRQGALTGKQGVLDPGVISNAVDKGTKWEEKSYGQLDIMRNHLEAIRRSAEVSNLGFFQQIGTAAGQATVGGKKVGYSDNAKDLQEQMRVGQYRGGQEAFDYSKQMKEPGLYTDRSSVYTGQAIKDMIESAKNIGDWFRKLPDSLKGSLEGMKQAFAKNDVNTANAELKRVEDEVRAAREAAKKMTGQQRDQALAEAQKKQDAATALYVSQSERIKTQTGGPQLAGIKAGDFGEDVRRQIASPAGRVTPAANVGGAARPTGSPTGTGGTPTAPGNVPTNVQVQQQGGSNRINVNVVVTATEVNGQPNSTHTPPGP